jgi:hypothetical protein
MRNEPKIFGLGQFNHFTLYLEFGYVGVPLGGHAFGLSRYQKHLRIPSFVMLIVSPAIPIKSPQCSLTFIWKLKGITNTVSVLLSSDHTGASTKNCFVSACQSKANVQISQQGAPCLLIRLNASTCIVRCASDITNIGNRKTTVLLKDLIYFSDIFVSATRRWVTRNFKIINWSMATLEILMHVLYSWIHEECFSKHFTIVTGFFKKLKRNMMKILYSFNVRIFTGPLITGYSWHLNANYEKSQYIVTSTLTTPVHNKGIYCRLPVHTCIM